MVLKAGRAYIFCTCRSLSYIDVYYSKLTGSYRKGLLYAMFAEKGVAEANRFDRDAIETDVLEIWKSLFDVEAKEATPTLQAIKNGILSDLFQPIDDKLAAEPQQD
ncbi:unnamed protein product [Microthlaspi erraticum]|uniref:Uncharacterized protein n=1 Tax=Microthlaspi erraticum TaxID=1685480 RepID=A0A6D2IJ01_9BRAS|nr:unnamed protein product [Microthlaspi erraticum]